jgi:hypothetical protein
MGRQVAKRNMRSGLRKPPPPSPIYPTDGGYTSNCNIGAASYTCPIHFGVGIPTKQVQHLSTNNTPDDDSVRVETCCVSNILRF